MLVEPGVPFLLLSLWTVVAAQSTNATTAQSTSATASAKNGPVCAQIAQAICSASQVFYPGSAGYQQDISHWVASSSASSVCSVEPGTAQDVGKILKIVGLNKSPFAVKGGGHTGNLGFSSTAGVQIAMSRFSQIQYNSASQTVTVGTGLVWDQVYNALQPYGVSVVGARTAGIGVAGFALGGGYSWKSNQYGLTIDTIVGYQLVTPSGTVLSVTESTYPHLFFALRGGFNNLGIVTLITLKTFPQSQVWGGLMLMSGQYYSNITAALLQYSSQVTDPKAATLVAYSTITTAPVALVYVFYDGPTPPSGIFDNFLAIPTISSSVSTTSYAALISSFADGHATSGNRGIFDTSSFLEYTPALLAAIVNETLFWGSTLGFDPGSFVSYAVEPFLPSLLSHSSSPSAYPPSRSQVFLPMGLAYEWELSSSDTAYQNAARQSTAYLTSLAQSEGQNLADASLYGNYAIYDTPVQSIYGQNLPALQTIKATVDPFNVMGLTGGFKF